MNKNNTIVVCCAIILGFVSSFLCFNFFLVKKKPLELAIFVGDFVDNYLSTHEISKSNFNHKWTLISDNATILCKKTETGQSIELNIKGQNYVIFDSQNKLVPIAEAEFKKSSLTYEEKVKDFIEYGKLVCLYE